jgi:hypothetical protein
MAQVAATVLADLGLVAASWGAAATLMPFGS